MDGDTILVNSLWCNYMPSEELKERIGARLSLILAEHEEEYLYKHCDIHQIILSCKYIKPSINIDKW